jgi:hypothetical protein
MPFFDWDAELTEEQRDALIEHLANRIAGYQLSVPAVFFLEMNKPLAFLAGQSVVLGSGFLAPLFGAQNVQQFSKLLESRENIDLLIRRIEERALAPEKGTSS